MTRSITVVNTSNWRNEAYEVIANGEMRMLEPGEHWALVGSDDGSLKIEASIPDGLPQARPFMAYSVNHVGVLQCRQVTPRLEVSFA